MRRLAAAAVLFCAFAAIFAFGADFWVKKPYAEWSDKEVKRLLSDSPWAKTFTLRRPVLQQTRREFGRFSSAAGEGEGQNAPEIDYVVYMRTAQPVREALVRTAQFEQKYDAMNRASRQAFDASWSQFLTASFPSKVIVQVKYSSNVTDIDRKLANYWQTQTLETMLTDSFLTGPDGKRVSPIAFWVGKGATREFQLAFPRPEPAAGNDSVAVEFKAPEMLEDPGFHTLTDAALQKDAENRGRTTPSSSTRVYLKFSLKDMEYKGAVTY
jgi:hypothetical protein